MSKERQTCPRRFEIGQQGSGADEWRKAEPLGGSEHIAPKFRSCSYCGSMHPDDFMAAVERGDVIGPTDKNYKAYVGKPYTDDEFESYKQRLGDELGDVRPAHDYGKFYFQHLSDAQKNEFIDLLNAKRVTIGYPGHFYRTPFFITYAK